MITQTEREEWFRSPVTREFVAALQDIREDAKDRWTRQAFVDLDDRERSDRLNLYALAGVEILNQVIDLVEGNRPQTREMGE